MTQVIADQFVELFVSQPEYFARFAAIEEHDTFFFKELSRINVFNGNLSNVLSIGSGEGIMEIDIATQWPHIKSVDCLDPSPSYTDGLKKKIEEKGLKNIHAHCKTFEEFETDIKYDLIVAVHVWYAFGENKEILEKAKKLLAPGGQLAIVVQEYQSITHALTAFNDRVDYSNLTSAEFSKWLSENGYPNEIQELPHWIPLETFITVADGKITQDGSDYASFLATRPYSTLSEEKQEAIKKIYLDKAVDGKINLACGLILMKP